LTGGPSYAQALSENLQTTYSHTREVLQKFEDHGLVESKRDGRTKKYRHTQEGQERAQALVDFLEAGGENQ